MAHHDTSHCIIVTRVYLGLIVHFSSGTWRLVFVQMANKSGYCHSCTVSIFWHFINTTAWHWADTSLHLPFAVRLPWSSDRQILLLLYHSSEHVLFCVSPWRTLSRFVRNENSKILRDLPVLTIWDHLTIRFSILNKDNTVVTVIVQWIRLHLPSWCPRFEPQAHHLRLIVKLCTVLSIVI